MQRGGEAGGAERILRAEGICERVLRAVARGLDRVEYPKDRMKELSVRYSCPEWILDLWKKTYEPDVIEAMLADFQTEKPLTVRCCLNRTTPEILKEELEAEGLRWRSSLTCPMRSASPVMIIWMNWMLFGMAFSPCRISAPCLYPRCEPRAGAEVIDVCAAPGGKALHMAEKVRWRMKLRVRRRAAMWKHGPDGWESGTDPRKYQPAGP